jgi:hypothetical protein
LNSGLFSDIFQNLLPLAAQNGEIVGIEAEHLRFKLHPLGHAPLAEQLSLNNDRIGQFHRRPVQEDHIHPVRSQDNADFVGQAGLQGQRGLADQQGDVVVALRAGGPLGLGAEEVGEKNLALACKVSLEGFYIGISMPI